MGLISNYLFRKAYRGPYVPLGSSRRTSLGSYNRAQRQLKSSYRRYRDDQDVIDNLADAAEALFNDSQEKRIFQDLVREVLESLPEISDLNPGQKAILEEFVFPGTQAANSQGKKFDSDKWVSDARLELGDEKYNAVSETIENTADLLSELANDLFNTAEWWWAGSESFAPLLTKGSAFTLRIRVAAQSAATEIKAYRRFSEALRKETTHRRRMEYSSPFNNDPTPDRAFGSNAMALANWRAGAVKKFASDFPELARRGVAWDSPEGRRATRVMTVRKSFQSMGYSNSMRGLGLKKENKYIGNGNYLSSSDRAKMKETRNKVTYWGYRW